MPADQRPEWITAYTLSYANWTVIPHHIEESFADMVDCGFNAVALSFSESEARYARRAFELQVHLAHQAGLKVFVVPSRIGGRLAGAPLMPSIWLSQNRHLAIPESGWMPVACLESDEVRQWFRDFMTRLLEDYELDGIIWDEPKAASTVSTHPATIATFGPGPTSEQMEDSYVDWLSDLTDHCRRLRNDLVVTLFCQKTDSERFTRQAAAIPGLDYVGYDGNLQRESFFHEEPKWLKYRLEDVWDRTQAEADAAGKKTFSLVENMLMPTAALEEYEPNLDAYLAGPLPDHLSIYYYAHNNEDPEATHAITRRLMQKHLK